jgi:hypothetical protein
MSRAAVATLILLLAAPAAARCPSSGLPSTKVCRQVHAFFIPGVIGLAYFPSDDATMGRWLGAGMQLTPFMWSHNSDRFGPGQGKIIFDIGLLDSSLDGRGRMLFWRTGGQLSFEKNASRAFGIPFFGATFGGIHERDLQDQAFFEASIGVHAIYFKNVIVTLEGGYLFPFDQVDELAGFRASLAANVTLW